MEECLRKIRETLFDEDSREVCRVMLLLVSNLVMYPGDPKYRLLNPGNKTISKLLEVYSSFLDFFTLLGFEPLLSEVSVEKNNRILYILKTENEDPEKIELGLFLLKEFARAVGVPEEKIPIASVYVNYDFKKTVQGGNNMVQEAKINLEGFDVYKSQSFSNNSVAAKGTGNAALEERIQALNLERRTKMIEAGAPERRIKVFPMSKNFNPRNFTSSVKTDNTVEEVQEDDEEIQMKAGKSLFGKTEKNKQFKTKAMRDMEVMRNKRVYTEIVFRVHLPNRWTVELFMSPLETFSDLKKILVEQVFVPSEFEKIEDSLYFYLTPPKRVFNSEEWTTTFDELGLAPASLVHLGFGRVDGKGAIVKGSQPILFENLVNSSFISSDSSPVIVPKGHVLNFEQQKLSSSTASEKSGKKPKWFKI